LAIFEFLKSVIHPKKVLEVGCDAGAILSRYVDIGCEVLGLDFDENHLAYAQKKGLYVRKGSFEQLRFYERYDLTNLSHLLEHVTSPR
jgi:2-polyprenyl-3-methyl-5-hydroxy-6-metoxy-1,4-benzoquinol methylase